MAGAPRPLLSLRGPEEGCGFPARPELEGFQCRHCHVNPSPSEDQGPGLDRPCARRGNVPLIPAPKLAVAPAVPARAVGGHESTAGLPLGRPSSCPTSSVAGFPHLAHYHSLPPSHRLPESVRRHTHPLLLATKDMPKDSSPIGDIQKGGPAGRRPTCAGSERRAERAERLLRGGLFFPGSERGRLRPV